MRPTIKKQNIKTLLETKFIKVFDLQYAEGRHYYNATRRSADDLVAEVYGRISKYASRCGELHHDLESIQR